MKNLILILTIVTFLVSSNTISDRKEIYGENLKGKSFSWSKYENHYVLIDFWASWCSPCRRENPNLVKTIKSFEGATMENGKKLEVISISLDQDKSKWEAAVEADQLFWDGHFSDLKGWKSQNAKEWGVNSIPSAFLINPEGKIIAKGGELRGSNLRSTLDNYLKSLKK
jgi:thiol-disulfide isomerase/thioredoxin